MKTLSLILLLASINTYSSSEMMNCESLGMKEEAQIKDSFEEASKFIRLDKLIEKNLLKDYHVEQLRATSSLVRFLKEETSYHAPDTDLSNNSVLVEMSMKYLGTHGQPYFRTVKIKGISYDEVEVGYGDADWLESTLFYAGTSKKIGINTYDGACRSE